MADIYENIVIGNFLVGFGIGVGLLHSSAPIEPLAVNLLQQTPMDKLTEMDYGPKEVSVPREAAA